MVKPKTINLNSVRLNTVALNHYVNISGGGSKLDPIAAWIRNHMAFRYDTKGYTNEVLSKTKQLKDLSGNNRPMLLNNFLFNETSGMDGDALVTDGVDDYGLVENLSSGVKMLFMTVEFMNTIKYLYDQRVDSTVRTFGIYLNGLAYNVANSGKTYINGGINISPNISVNDLLKKKHIITISNNNVDETNSTQPHFFMSIPTNNYFVKSAFYNAIGFDSIPTEEDGFTEQELIDYVIEKYELNKI